MRGYWFFVAGLSGLVDLLLLLGTNRLCGFPPGLGRALIASALGALYSGVCLLPGFSFLGSFLWRLISLGVMAMIAFDLQPGSLRRGSVFVFLCMALGGAATGLGGRGIWPLAAAGGIICLLCLTGLRGTVGRERLVPVELCYGDKQVSITALQDTGNTLRDPVSGSPVLVIGAQAAQRLTGLTVQQLEKPVEAMGALPGLRLIPYRAVGTQQGLLLALKLQQVRIGRWKGSRVVAFAPAGLEGKYEGLIGGAA